MSRSERNTELSKLSRACFSLAAVLLCLTTTACHQKAPPKAATAVFRLFDLFQPDDLTNKVNPEDVGWKRVEWKASEMAPWTPPAKPDPEHPRRPDPAAAAISFHALHDVDDLQNRQGQLSGTATGATPLVHFALKENRGGAASVKFIEVRMKVSGAKQAWLRPESGAAVDEEAAIRWASQTNAWNSTADITDGKLQTYRFEYHSNRGSSGSRGGGGGGRPSPTNSVSATNVVAATNSVVAANDPSPTNLAGLANALAPTNTTNTGRMGGPPPGGGAPGGGGDGGSGSGGGDFRDFLLTFRDGKAAKFSIESIRFVSDKEEKLKDASGQQWAGLGEIYRATLAEKTPENIRIPLRELPERPRLEFAIGTREDEPIHFKMSIATRGGAKEPAPAVLFERTVTIPNRWQTVKLDLAAYAGKSVVLEMSVAGEKKGLWGYWGSPVVRSSLPVPAATPGVQARVKPRGVIFLVIDTLRKDHLNLYGYSRETLVHLNKFAEEGVAFNHAISQGTMTKISVPSMMTSLYPMSETVLTFDHGLPASAKTIAEVFREQGYATVAYSSVPFTGKANNMHQGYDELHEVGSISESDYRTKTARHYVDRLITWLEEHQDAPFFVFLHVFDPHSPFRPRPPYDTLWGAPGAQERLAEIEAEVKKQKMRTSRDNMPNKEDYVKAGHDPAELLKIYTDWYDGSIRGVDAEIGRLLEALRTMGLDQDTLMVWGTDHGEELWDHGQFFHGHSVYGELNQVPMAFHWPNSPAIRKGVKLDQQVQNLDIMPTILDLVGITGPTNMQGRSLVPLLDGSGVATWQERPAVTQAMVGPDRPPGADPGPPNSNSERPHFGIIDHGWKLVRKEIDPDTVEELFEHPVDALNQTNIIKSEGHAARTRTLNELLAAWKTRAKAAELPSDDSMVQELSSEELRRLRALGYVGGTSTPKTNPPSSKTNAPGASATTNQTVAPATGTVAGTNALKKEPAP